MVNCRVPTQVISTHGICPNCRQRRESLVLVVVLVIGNDAIENEDDLIAAPPRCAVSRVANVADPGPEQSQRDCGLQPKVGEQRLPWVRVRKSNLRQRRCGRGQACGREQMGRNRVAVGDDGLTMTQVARASQPWALGRNPVGILERNANPRVAAGSPARRWLDVSAASLRAKVLRVANVANPLPARSCNASPVSNRRYGRPPICATEQRFM